MRKFSEDDWSGRDEASLPDDARGSERDPHGSVAIGVWTKKVNLTRQRKRGLTEQEQILAVFVRARR